MTVSWIFVKRFLIASVTMLVSMSVLWFGLWQLGAAQYRAFIDDWINSHRATGYQLTYDNRETEGFPRRITLHFSNFVLQNPDGIKISAHDVSLSSFPWQWYNIDAKLKHGFELIIPFSEQKNLVISTEQTVRSRTELDMNGDWKFVNLELTEAKGTWGQSPLFNADEFAVDFERPLTPPNTHTDIGMSFNGHVINLLLPSDLSEPFGPKVPKIDVSMQVMGSPPDPRRKDAVAAWTAASGTVQFNKFYMEWGPLYLSSRGWLGLDDELQPEGGFSSLIGNHEEVIKNLLAHGYIPKRQAGMLDSALSLFAKKTSLSGTPGIEMPITVQLGGFFLGPVRVFEYSEIQWDPPTPEATPETVPAPAATSEPETPGLPAK